MEAMKEEALATIESGRPRERILLSVRELVEFLGRNGNIDDRSQGRDSLAAMQAGSRLHRRLQKQGTSAYHPEVPLRISIDMGEYDLEISGRADGIIYEQDDRGEIGEESLPVIDEIKGMYQDVLAFEEPLSVHFAQAKVYAWIFAKEHGLSGIRVQMTYANLDTEQIRRFQEDFGLEDLGRWFDEQIKAYRPWADFRFHWKQLRNESIRALDFPYAYRPGQKKLASDVYRSIHRGKTLFIQAPTGAGKTLSVLFPAIKAMGEKEADRIFYLTAKSVTRSVAKDSIHLLTDGGYRGKTTEIVARDKMCLLQERSCNPEDCPYARGHFDRINAALYDCLTSRDLFDRNFIMEYAKQSQVCPFELCLDLASFSDNIFCDYNYVFDPNASLTRFFGEGRREENLLLVDEAHNLVDRARQMYSETLFWEDFHTLRRLFKGKNPKLMRAAGKCSRFFSDWTRDLEDYRILDNIDSFVLALMNVASCISVYLEEGPRLDEHEQILEIYFRIRYFLTVADWLDQRYRIVLEELGKNAALHLDCMDPSQLLGRRIELARSCIFFSATLLPIRYYKDLLSADRQPYAVYADSVFKEEQHGLVIASDVSSRYQLRNPATYRRYADYIRRISHARQGNYMVFFPSYRFMEDVYGEFLLPGQEECEVLVQEREMSEENRESFLGQLQKKRKSTLLAFCVIGGIFSEGIDLPGDSLIGAVIVGMPLPQVNRQTRILKDYFDSRSSFDEDTEGLPKGIRLREKKEGFAYAYLYPGMNKVLQAAGRVIRTERDRGIIALLDDRFLRGDYQDCFPREWKHYQRVSIGTVESQVGKFWNQTDVSDQRKGPREEGEQKEKD